MAWQRHQQLPGGSRVPGVGPFHHEGERGTIGTKKWLWCERYPQSQVFPVVRLVLAGTDDCNVPDRWAELLQQRILGIRLWVVVAALPRPQRQR